MWNESVGINEIRPNSLQPVLQVGLPHHMHTAGWESCELHVKGCILTQNTLLPNYNQVANQGTPILAGTVLWIVLLVLKMDTFLQLCKNLWVTPFFISIFPSRSQIFLYFYLNGLKQWFVRLSEGHVKVFLWTLFLVSVIHFVTCWKKQTNKKNTNFVPISLADSSNMSNMIHFHGHY